DHLAERGGLLLAGQLFKFGDCFRSLELGVEPVQREVALEVLSGFLRPCLGEPEDLAGRQSPYCDGIDSDPISNFKRPSDKASSKGMPFCSAASLARWISAASFFFRASRASARSSSYDF